MQVTWRLLRANSKLILSFQRTSVKYELADGSRTGKFSICGGTADSLSHTGVKPLSFVPKDVSNTLRRASVLAAVQELAAVQAVGSRRSS